MEVTRDVDKLANHATTPLKASLVGMALCILSMISIQVGAALSGPVMEKLGSFGATWLRLLFATLFLVPFVRPRIRDYDVRHWQSAGALGCAMAIMTLCFFASIQYISLSLAVAIDFLGPLTVAALYGRGVWRILCPLIAAAGVLCLSWDGRSWTGNTAGAFLALGAAVGWAGYIILMKRVGRRFAGLEGLALSLLFATLVATPLGVIEALQHVTPMLALQVALLAILVPLMPYSLEYLALKRMQTFSFGLLMSLEPAVGAAIGLLVLGQGLAQVQMLGIAMVVGASAIGSRLQVGK
ncbi:EamA family transporter [Rhizobium sp. XQZ8]|uniref:EamA family transporter n=1 Tax=Rhizobium populisoli TaxID=2859785 RepID=UPI001CA57D9A|nr:EamA family transporter [Rhizobium populisoli]MBW6425564.1 EamA family transporter [Rhizobium populisoli]